MSDQSKEGFRERILLPEFMEAVYQGHDSSGHWAISPEKRSELRAIFCLTLDQTDFFEEEAKCLVMKDDRDIDSLGAGGVI